MDRERLIERQANLIQVIEAIDAVIHSKEWQVVRETFDKRVESLERQIISEAKNSKIEIEKLYFLQGQLSEIKRYDLATYADMCQKELQGIKQNLQ